MEEKVAYTMKLIEEDGDSFAKRAEMYYKKRPELINFVEEAYRAYRALAERYDHISTELQNANTTIAAVFPEQVQFAMDDDDEDALPKTQRKHSEIPKQNIPNVPKTPMKDLKSIVTTATKKLRPSKSTKRATAINVVKSGLSKPEGLKEIDKLQKRILALQTEKEFVKSSYESRLAKYWEIESQIKEVQERVSRLQDEFGEGIVIEDEEARNLMTSAALRSCQETLAQLQEKQERSAEEAKIEQKKIKDARNKFESLKDELLGNEISQKKPSVKDDSMKAVEALERLDQEVGSTTRDRKEVESLRENIGQIEGGSIASLTVTEMAEKIDEIVNKLVSLETAFSSQTSLIQRLRAETDELQTQIQTLEGEKATLINSKIDLSNKLMETEGKLHKLQGLNSSVDLRTEIDELQTQIQTLEGENVTLINSKIDLSNKLIEMEEKLQRLQGLNCSIDDHNRNPQAAFTEARNLDYLSEKPQSENPEEEHEFSPQKEKSVKVKMQEQVDGQEGGANPGDGLKQLEIVPLFEVPEDKTSLEQERTSQKEEESTVQVRLQEIDGQEGILNPSNGLNRLQSPELSQELDVKTSSEKENVSPVKGQYWEEFEGFGYEPHLSNDKQHSKKPDEELRITDLTEKGEISVDQVGSVEEFKEQEEKHDLSTMPGIQVEVLSQRQAEDASGGLLEQTRDQMTQDKVDDQASSRGPENLPNVERLEETTEQGDEPDWKQMFLRGLENREKVLLKEYTSVLRNYKELKKKHDEEDMKSGENISQITVQLEVLKSANSKKDEEIRFLLEKLKLLQAGIDDNNDMHDQPAERKVTVIETSRTLPSEREVEILLMPVDQPQIISEIEEKFRMRIDELLEENLDFWLRFSTSFSEIQKFETEVKDLQDEVSKLQEKQKRNEGSNSIKYSLRSDVRPLYKHLREIQTKLTLWMEKCALLKEELTSRFSSLCNIQEEITGALKTSAEDDDFKFTSYQAAKFQGEVLNMKQENNKVADELQAGLDHVTSLQMDIEKTLTLLSEEFGLSESKRDPGIGLPHSDSKTRVPLRSFIFGVKQKKQRPSLLSCMHPALAKKYNGLRSGSSR